MPLKQCLDCKEYKETQHYPKQRCASFKNHSFKTWFIVKSYCKPCANKRAMESKAKNPDKYDKYTTKLYNKQKQERLGLKDVASNKVVSVDGTERKAGK